VLEPAPDVLEPGSAFATETMAGLLEQQGDESGAERIRAALDPAAPTTSEGVREMTTPPDVIGTLERWLTNLRGDRP
jgi:hypothetical protein